MLQESQINIVASSSMAFIAEFQQLKATKGNS